MRFPLTPRMGRVVGLDKIALPGPTIKRGKSVQVVETPWEFVRAVEKQWGKLTIDLAGTQENKKAPIVITPEMGSLSKEWHKQGNCLQWLNPEWANIAPWVAKCAGESKLGARIILLSRASLDANWWWEYVAPFAVSYTPTPRLVFPNQVDRLGNLLPSEKWTGYPQPLAISLYNVEDKEPGLAGRWHWQKGTFDYALQPEKE